ncbi:hypothetical protein [Bacillus sp. AK031]
MMNGIPESMHAVKIFDTSLAKGTGLSFFKKETKSTIFKACAQGGLSIDALL